MTSNGKPYARVRYKEIIQEQILIGYLTKGGVTYHDTEEMSPYERGLALDSIQEILREQNKASEDTLKKAIAQESNKENSVPKSGLNH